MPLPHFYQSIDGWFSDEYEWFFRDVVPWLPDPARVCEVGCWLGKSTAYLAVETANSGKAVDIVCVDTWSGDPGVDRQMEVVATGRDLFAEFWDSLSRGGVSHLVRTVRQPSAAAATLFPWGHFDLVFIDADHSYEAVRDDIAMWRYRVRDGGLLAGHDYDEWHGGVVRAVNEAFGSAVKTDGNVWFVGGERPPVRA